MKKVIFKWVTTIIDYKTEEEAKADIRKMRQEGKYLVINREGWNKQPTFSKDGKDEDVYTVEILTRFNKKVNTGF